MLEQQTDRDKKESFVNFLLEQYHQEHKKPAADDNGMRKIIADVQRLTERVAAVDERLGREYAEKYISYETRLLNVLSEVAKLHDVIFQHIYPSIEQLITRERVAQETAQAVPVPAEPFSGGMELLERYEAENLRLKRSVLSLMRSSYERKFRGLPPEQIPAKNEAAALAAARTTEELIKRIKTLEEQKAQLIRDNIEINMLSQEIADENKALSQKITGSPGETPDA